jgi:hypothetical protein
LEISSLEDPTNAKSFKIILFSVKNRALNRPVFL